MMNVVMRFIEGLLCVFCFWFFFGGFLGLVGGFLGLVGCFLETLFILLIVSFVGWSGGCVFVVVFGGLVVGGGGRVGGVLLFKFFLIRNIF